MVFNCKFLSIINKISRVSTIHAYLYYVVSFFFFFLLYFQVFW